jgi:hypothetical protein
VDDNALLYSRDFVLYLTSKRPEFREILKDNQVRISLFGTPDTSSLPEYSGTDEPGGFAMGMTDASMTANADWLCWPGHPNIGGNPVIHEMVHTINHIVFEQINETYFYERIFKLAEDAIKKEVFKAGMQKLAKGETQNISHMIGEYWATTVEGYIMDRQNFKDSHDTRDWIEKNDPKLYDLITRYFPTEKWDYCPTP